MSGDAERERPAGATISPDTRWMTYKEMADFLSMKEESARRRAQRDGWPRQLGSDGRTRVGVRGDAIATDPASSGAASGVADGGDDHPGEMAVLREALARERERADRAEAAAAAVPDLRERAGRAEARATAAEELAERLGKELGEARERGGRAEGEAAVLRDQLKAERNRSVTQMREVEAARDAAVADLAEWTAGRPLARAIRALVCRRGRK